MIPLNTILGDLTLDEIFIEYDGPQLFTCFDEKGRQLIAVHAPATDTDNWIYAYVSADRLNGVRLGDVSLRDAFILPEQNEVLLVSFKGDKKSPVDVEAKKPASMPGDWFPDEGEFLEPIYDTSVKSAFPTNALLTGNKQNEVVDFSSLSPIRSPFRELPAFIIQANPMWDLSPEALEFLRSKRTPVSVVATRSGRHVFDAALKSGENRTDIPVRDLAGFLVQTQKVVESFTSDLSSDILPRRRRPRFHEETRLSAVVSYPSSFGLRIETQATLFANPAISLALQKMIFLLATRGSKSETEAHLHGLSNTSILHFRAFAKAVAKNQAGFSIELGTPGQAEILSAVLDHPQLDSLIRVLEAKNTRDEHTESFVGRLIGVSLKTKFFMIEGERETISGRVSEQCMSTMYGKTIGQTYTANIKIITDVDEITGNESEKFVLLEIKSDMPQSTEVDTK